MRPAAALALSLALGLPGPAQDPGDPNEKKIKVGSLERTYRIHVPSSYAKSKPAPLVFFFHGGGTNTEAKKLEFLGFNALADKDGAIVVYPAGVEGNWKDGRDVPQFREKLKDVDDIQFVSDLIDRLSGEYSIDPKRIYATGPSNGGIFSQYLAIKLSNRIAAIGCVIGSVAKPAADPFKPDQPLSVLMMNGTEDSLVPFEGGAVARNRGEVIGARDAAKKWVDHNGCRPEPTKEALPDADKADGCTASRELWTGGRNGTEVVLYTLHGAGHTWPGLPDRRDRREISGKTCRDINATELIWEFFMRHTKP
jgi:polyhydroxybutyrate depolymerase